MFKNIGPTIESKTFRNHDFSISNRIFCELSRYKSDFKELELIGSAGFGKVSNAFQQLN
jgi:hypothetical protein